MAVFHAGDVVIPHAFSMQMWALQYVIVCGFLHTAWCVI